MTQSPIPLSRFDLPRPPRRAARRVAVAPLVKADAANPTASPIVERYAYDGFGRELPSSTPIINRISPFAFSTKYLDAETGMNYYGYRFYVSDVGRWINRDPISERGGNNVYVMLVNNVLLLIDVNGNGFWHDVGEALDLPKTGKSIGKAINSTCDKTTELAKREVKDPGKKTDEHEGGVGLLGNSDKQSTDKNFVGKTPNQDGTHGSVTGATITIPVGGGNAPNSGNSDIGKTTPSIK